MKHIELIELLYKHRHIIDEAFQGNVLSQHPPSQLIDEVAIFQKVAKEYELSSSYIEFANTMLKRVDANYTFGDYQQEIKRLIEYKGDYLESGDYNILMRIKGQVRSLYKKIVLRDTLINARINDIINDNDLSMELVLKDAKDIDSRITELIEAHSQNLHILGSELRGLDSGLDDMLVDINIELQPYTENIHQYNQRLSDFILRTQKRKEQNKKLASLSNKILKEQDYGLRALLLSNSPLYHHTLNKKHNIAHLPSPVELEKSSFIKALSKLWVIEKKQRKAPVDKPYQKPPSVEHKAVKLHLIEQDIINDRPQDIYEYILEHNEIQKFDQQQNIFAFKTYLTIIQNHREKIDVSANYNQYDIRIVQWI